MAPTARTVLLVLTALVTLVSGNFSLGLVSPEKLVRGMRFGPGASAEGLPQDISSCERQNLMTPGGGPCATGHWCHVVCNTRETIAHDIGRSSTFDVFGLGI